MASGKNRVLGPGRIPSLVSGAKTKERSRVGQDNKNGLGIIMVETYQTGMEKNKVILSLGIEIYSKGLSSKNERK